MKSIKEEALDYADEHGFRVPYDGSNNYYDETDVKASKEGFEAGANYVIGEIEKMIPSSDDELENHTKCKSAIFRLQTIIEQLKK